MALKVQLLTKVAKVRKVKQALRSSTSKESYQSPVIFQLLETLLLL